MKWDPNYQPRPGPHRIACIEVDDGIFEISCTCGEQTWTPWGQAHAEEVARLHCWVTGTPIKVSGRMPS